jgi:poly-gamma-glutamate synthesis protein (capsule biosynthesis protein)
MFDRRLLAPRLFFVQAELAACHPGFEAHLRYPFVNSPESRDWLEARGEPVDGIWFTSHAATSLALAEPVPEDPFAALAPELRRADVVFGNLECPLSARGRRMANDCAYRGEPRFAARLAEAGFRVLSLANNHAFDYGETALLDTLGTLASHGLAGVGAGPSLSAARAPAWVEAGGLRLAFLAYSLVGPEWAYAGPDECGVAPLNPLVVQQDIERVRPEADLVLLSLHWGVELAPLPTPRQAQLARHFIDLGADAVLGHHAHVPGSIEIYRGRPILYSLGNFCFGHDHDTWGHDMLVRLDFEGARLRALEVVPVRGRWQPAPVNGQPAEAFHRHLTRICAPFGTAFDFDGACCRLRQS